MTKYAFVTVVCFLMLGAADLGLAKVAAAPAHRTVAEAPCSGPLPPGPLREPPQVYASALPLNDLGDHELIMRVRRDGDRFCYRYTLDGETYNRAPALHVEPGERFALRIVNAISGPARGLTLGASALPQCLPQRMPAIRAQHFVGYLDRITYSRHLRVADLDTNVHLHGFQGPASQENVFLSTLSTPDHACEYVVTIPIAQPPGTYFYHPHAHGVSEDEIDGGLDGMWIVDPQTPSIGRGDEHDVILRYRVPYENHGGPIPDYTALYLSAAAHEASIKPRPLPSFDPFDPPPWPSSIPLRYRNTSIASVCGTRDELRLTVNGADLPATLTVPPGRPQLLRLLNGSGDALLLLRMRAANGRDVPMHVVGRDGVPVGGDFAHPLDRYAAANGITFLPAGRRDLLVSLKAGERETLYAAQFCSAPGDAIHLQRDILTIAGGPGATPARTTAARHLQPGQSPAQALIRYVGARTSDVRKRAFTYTEYVLPTADGKSAYAAYMITQTSNPAFHERTFYPVYASKRAMTPRPDVTVRQGAIEEWYLYNATLESHTFHIHQMDFVVEDARNGPETVDTAYIPPAKVLPDKADPDYPLLQPSLTRVILDFRHVPPGTFVFHCHMMHHEDRGMMGVIQVE